MMFRKLMMIALASTFGLAAQEAPTVEEHESEIVVNEEELSRNDECSSRRSCRTNRCCPEREERCEKKCEKKRDMCGKKMKKGAAKKVVEGE